METTVPGVFACGNVLQVHDLVDFVSDESARAGEAAAEYVHRGGEDVRPVLAVENGAGVTYTVPQRIRWPAPEEGVSLSFRVNRVFGRSAVTVRAGERQLARFKRERMTPGEMEHILLPAKLLESAGGERITVSVEEAEA